MDKHDYNGPEILSELIRNPNKGINPGKIKLYQKVDVQCSKCKNIKTVGLYGHIINRLNSKESEYLCSDCVNGKRITMYNISNTGISLFERLGEDIARQSIERRKQTILKNEENGIFISRPGNTKTWIERYGEEEAARKKEWLRYNNKLVPKFGEDNPQWGKPAHKLSGKGIKGYYNGVFFRSLMEASFIINFLEKNNLKYENGELRKFAIPYIFEGRKRNYFCDYVVENNYYEIKPLALHTQPRNVAKWDAAKMWCEKNLKTFKIFSEQDFTILSREDVDKLKISGNIILL